MKKIIMLMLGVIVASFTSVFSQDLDGVLKQFYEVNGADKVAKLKSVTAKGKIMQYGMEMDFTTITQRPHKLYLEVPIQGQLMKQGYNGEVGWMIAPWTGSLDPIEMTGIQLKSLERQSDMDGMLVNYKDKGYTTTYEGEDDMEGTPVYVIKQVDPDGDIFMHYIDKDNLVMLKTKATLVNQGSTIEAETYYSNYKPVEGIIMPFNIESKVGGQTQSQIIISEYTFNDKADDSIFEKPAPVPKTDGQE